MSFLLAFLSTLLFVWMSDSLSNTPVITPAKRALLDLVDGSTSRPDAVLLACPESLTPLSRRTRAFGVFEESYYFSPSYGSKYEIKDNTFIDLTIPEEQDEKPFWTLSSRERVGSRFFQNPFISSIYERGYRQNFENAGFPGIDKEYAEIERFFLASEDSSFETFFSSSSSSSAAADEEKRRSSPPAAVLDLSCGSGFMTRKLLGSRQFPSVLAADLSPTMLAETKRRCIEEGLWPSSSQQKQQQQLMLLRCDAARLPLADASLDCVVAGAAMHCWPQIGGSLSEIYRVLKPGGRFYASTFFASTPLQFQVQLPDFLTDAASSLGIPSNSNNKKPAGQRYNGSGFYLFSDEQEIFDLVQGAGWRGEGIGGAVKVRKEGRGCAIIKAVKDK